ncbi:hypothetical protein BpHYR1_006738 [Brachionus plicatilis]|uniref:Uncharacterized protein n=1 Tax=Brachionus plicatilis TaxID=10195 RepID=A0A3M7P376_BRAPC|nr:hypothetical protein BpHYR1_006738 [Brachionus plicatilis]
MTESLGGPYSTTACSGFDSFSELLIWIKQSCFLFFWSAFFAFLTD